MKSFFSLSGSSKFQETSSATVNQVLDSKDVVDVLEAI